jgi:tetratricopeptide (TPR) repeat protein
MARISWLAALLAAVLLTSAPAIAQNANKGNAEINALSRRAAALDKAGKPDEAIAAYEQAIRRARQIFGAQSTTEASLLIDLGLVYHHSANYARAEALYLRALSIREAKLGKDHAGVGLVLNNLGVLYKVMGEHVRAEQIYQRALAIREKSLGKDHADVAQTLNNLGMLYKEMGRLAQAEPLIRRALLIRVMKLGKDSPAVADSLNDLALLYKERGRYARAEQLLQQCLAIREKKAGKNDVSIAGTLNNLAIIYKAMGDYPRAEKLYQRSYEIKEARYGKDHPEVGSALNNLANLYQDMGEGPRAEKLFLQSLAIREKKLGKDHLEVARTLNNLGVLYKNLGRYAEAEPMLQRALSIREKKLGKDHTLVAGTLNDMALLYQKTGQYAKSEQLLLQSLAIREKKLGKDHPEIAGSLNNLAIVYRATGQTAKVEPLYRRSLEIWEAHFGKDHPDVATALNNLALVYQDLDQFDKAEPMLKRSLAIREAKLGKDHPHVATSLRNLAELHKLRGEYAEAKPLYRRALAIRELRLGKDHPDVSTTLNSLASLCAQTNDVTEAGELFDRSRRGARRHLASVLPALSEADKEAFFKNTPAHSGLELALALSLAHRDDAALSERSASWLLNGKAIDQESLASSALLTRESGDPELGKLAGRLRTLRQQLARLTFAAPKAGEEKQRLSQIDELGKQEQELGRKLRLAGSHAALPAWLDLADVRKRLPDDTVLIDIAQIHRVNFKIRSRKRWFPPRYVAWVTAKSGTVRVVDLGLAKKIDELVTQVRQGLQSAPKDIEQHGEAKAEEALRERMAALSALVLKPLLPHVGDARRLLISPDGNLWLLPWEALPLEDGSCAIERYAIRYLSSGRDLVPATAGRVKAGPPLVLADPDFNLDPRKGSSSAGPLRRRSTNNGPGRALPEILRLGRISALPGTAAEAKAIFPSLKAYAGVAPRVHTRDRAREAVVKAARSPRVLVLCTHGFFLPDQQAPPDEKGKTKAVKKWENPLLRCGLLLAGCNNAAKVRDGDDGVLTGLEVVGLDLRGTELVVLSACDTGVGDVQTGEGVSGLRRAFQIAGARGVVSTLWQVPDVESARLMAFFFDNLGRGMNKADALRAAKLHIIKDRRAAAAAAHPFFWAAFTLTGES